jgi:hypothetical protein
MPVVIISANEYTEILACWQLIASNKHFSATSPYAAIIFRNIATASGIKTFAVFVSLWFIRVCDPRT